MSVNELFDLWIKNAKDDKDLINELKDIKGQDEEIYDRFYKELEFGTAGLRGVIGAGTNRMNVYTVRRTTQGLANYLKKKYQTASVAIAYDSRIKADFFAKEAARVLAANGISVYLTTELQPTPVLSFAVREFRCQSGIMITASHNPAKYNGYKCYGFDGCQMTDNDANAVYAEIQKVDMFSGVKTTDFKEAVKNGEISFIEDSFYQNYLDCVAAQSINQGICNDAQLKVVYTPLNGAGNKLVRSILDRIGVKNVIVVKEQEYPDGNFPTCPYPNPEFQEALQLALKLAEKEKPDLVLATDPDSDRVGIAVKNREENYRLMTGNEVGILLLHYILSCRKQKRTLPSNPVTVKTIVSSELIGKIAQKYKCELRNVLTGFKYIGEQILRLEEKQEENRFVFGFEESYGYLVGTYVRDKDAVVASMIICEMTAYYKKQGKLLCDVLNELYDLFGYYQNTTLNFEFEGAAGMKKMQEIMASFRKESPSSIAGIKIIRIKDYETSLIKDIVTGDKERITLPKSNVLSYSLEGGSEVIIRPSGTEPKIKVYVTSVGKDYEDAALLKKRISEEMTQLLKA